MTGKIEFKTIQTIGQYAFYAAEINIIITADSVLTIDEHAFVLSGVSGEITFWEYLSSISESAFEGTQIWRLTVFPQGTISDKEFTKKKKKKIVICNLWCKWIFR